MGLSLVLLMLSFSVFDSKGGEILDPSKHVQGIEHEPGREEPSGPNGGCRMIKNNGRLMKIKIKAMVQEKEGSGNGVRGSFMSIDHNKGTRSWQGQDMSKFFQFLRNQSSIGIIAYFN